MHARHVGILTLQYSPKKTVSLMYFQFIVTDVLTIESNTDKVPYMTV